MKRPPAKKRVSEYIALWISKPLLESIDLQVALEDIDRSKFIRRALRNEIAKLPFLKGSRR